VTRPAVIREATAADVAAITDVVNRAFLVEQFFVEGDRTSPGEVADRMRRGAFLVAELEAGLVASVFVQASEERGYFGMLAVDPVHQGTGLGRLLVHAAEEWCRARGCSAVDIHVVNVRTELPAFYRRLGYVDTGCERPFPDPDRAKLPCACAVMTKELGAVRTASGVDREIPDR
jgi:GNAT superfamily N-acetyltransferase